MHHIIVLQYVLSLLWMLNAGYDISTHYTVIQTIYFLVNDVWQVSPLQDESLRHPSRQVYGATVRP